MRRMKSRIVAIVAIVALLVNMAAPAYAETPMTRVYVSLTASDGTPLIPGVTRYQSPPTGSIAYFGQGVESGMLYHDFPATTTNVKVWTSHNGTTSSQVIQDVSTNPVFNFRTNRLTLKLTTCDGEPLQGGRARMKVGTTTMYFPPSGAVLTGADGKTSAEVFPGTYDFEMGYNATAQWKNTQVVPDADHEIAWTTTKVTLSWPGAISYGGSQGDGRFFTKPSMEMMPSTDLRFHFRAYTGTPGSPGFTTDLSFSGCSFTYPQVNQPPTADAGGPYTVDEGSQVQLDASGSSDPDGSLVSYEWDLDNDGLYDDAMDATPTWTFADDGVYTVSVRVTDDDGASSVASAIVTVSNVAPNVGAITAPLTPLAVGNSFSASADFTDPGVLDTHTAVWDWGDGTTSAGDVTETDGSGSVSGTHAYATPGVYSLKLTVIDKDGGTTSALYEYVVAYDPSAGFVTGGGWIDSPAGAYAANPALVGKATFGFVAKYKKGATVPDGNTQFHFKAGDLNFKSTSYEWLVVAGKTAKFKGEGTINGQGSYEFMISAVDGSPDTFRMQIWGEGGSVYDNGSQQALGGGSIVVHN